MAALLQFRRDMSANPRDAGADGSTRECETMGQIIIFPGVRRARADLDLSHRLMCYASEGGPAKPLEP